MNTKKAQLGNLQGLVWGIVVIAIMIAIGLVVMVELRDTDSVSGAAETAINESIDAVSEIPGWLVIIVIVVIAAIILGLIQMFKSR